MAMEPRVLLEALFGQMEDGWVSVLQDHGDRMEVTWVEAPEAPDALTQKDWGQVDTWVGVATRPEPLGNRRGGAKDCYLVPALWADLDIRWPGAHATEHPLPEGWDGAEALLAAFPLPPSFVVVSGHGLQGWWLLDEPITAEAYATTIQRRWAATWARVAASQGVHVDPVWNVDRVLRLPGTTNVKLPEAPVPVYVLRGDEGIRYAPTELDDALDEAPEPVAPTQAPVVPYSGPQRPGDAFNASTRCEAVLAGAGWEMLDRRGPTGSTYWSRPGKVPAGVSAEVHADNQAQVYSSSAWASWPALKMAAEEKGRMLDPFGLLAALHFGGDVRAASAWLGAQGWGMPAEERQALQEGQVRALMDMARKPHLTVVREDGQAPQPEPEDASSWEPKDLVRLRRHGDLDRPRPTIGAVGGLDVGLFYPGKTHSVIGESESGKTWLCLAAATEVLREGGSVLFVDFEDDERTALERLDGLGVTDDELARFHYVNPDGPLFGVKFGQIAYTSDWPVFWKVCQGHQLVIVDGFNEALSIHGLSMNEATDISHFYNTWLRPLSRSTGAAVVSIDHVSHASAKEGKVGSAVGSQHKRSGADVMFQLMKLRPFARGAEGEAKVMVAKDRPGVLRGLAQGARREELAAFTMGSSSSGQEVRWVLQKLNATTRQAPSVAGFANPTVAAVLAFIRANPGTTTLAVREAVQGGNEAIVGAVEHLLALGAVERTRGPRNAWLLRARDPHPEDAQPPVEGPEGAPGALPELPGDELPPWAGESEE